ncbi:DUF2383 domain-containing protein [Tamlana fucoidanivorans]|uniref:DUF2383 domain-containing protein n=1 Tax=Allotamlana fucoidanivorans TaxID=2583814 RepID=A0A5C4SNF6_9FLAO|nr:DUF2383 domain-containing protein [Tamlana fucoidanivorans]TNJ45328.1 DUF2383 domain-containing protein [Tamlana fucoidanivorans]
MKHAERMLKKLNDLMVMNNTIEKIYLEVAHELVVAEQKAFLKRRAYKRRQFVAALKLEIIKIGGAPVALEKSSSEFWMKFKTLLIYSKDDGLLDEIFNLKAICVKKYNEALSEINMPLSTCKLLLKQVDVIQNEMGNMKRQAEFIS